nr:MAG TPA: hypothetical protein [Caudoviricetes sp.]
MLLAYFNCNRFNFSSNNLSVKSLLFLSKHIKHLQQ